MSATYVEWTCVCAKLSTLWINNSTSHNIIECNYLSMPQIPAYSGTKVLQCTRKTFMIYQKFVRLALYILFKFVKSLIRHLGLAIGNVMSDVSDDFHEHWSIYSNKRNIQQPEWGWSSTLFNRSQIMQMAHKWNQIHYIIHVSAQHMEWFYLP